MRFAKPLLLGVLAAVAGFIAGMTLRADATVRTAPVGNIVALIGSDMVLTAEGELWVCGDAGDWRYYWDIPVPIDQVHFIDYADPGDLGIIDTAGNLWEGHPNSAPWVNRGAPPEPPVGSSSHSLGDLKGRFGGKSTH